MKELDIHKRFKVVVRDPNGKVKKIHETQGSKQTEEKIHTELSWICNHKPSSKDSITITALGD